MPKLLIQIPCYNEEATLAQTIAALPKTIAGIDRIEVQVIDDGSIDSTVQIAKDIGVDHILSIPHSGLAKAFKFGLDNAVRLGFDVLVNTDADNQYCADDIASLVAPIIQKQADMVIGRRPISKHPEFSTFKKFLQHVGSWVMRKLAKVPVQDATSGFRAYGKNALLRLNVYTSFSYTLETLIQAGFSGLRIISTDVRVNRKTRESRLFRSTGHFLFRQITTIAQVCIIYRAVEICCFMMATCLLISVAIVGRYLVLTHYFGAPAGNFWPSIIFAATFFALSLQFGFTGILSAVLKANRKLSEEIFFRLRESQWNNGKKIESV